MAEISNELKLRALGMVPPKGFPSFSPLDVVEYRWPLQECKVSVVHAFERDLSLLEKFTLRSIRKIPLVTTSEISERLALAEPEIINQTVDSLLNATSIKLNRHREATQGKDTSENWEFEITKYGKELLAMGKITEPVRTRQHDLVRSIHGGRWMSTTGNGFDRDDLEDLQNPGEECTEPNSQDVHKALVESDQFDDKELVIQEISLKEGFELGAFKALRVCIVLAFSNEGKGIRFFAYLRSTTERVEWMEDILNSNHEIADDILANHFSNKHPPNQNVQSELSSGIRPLLYFNRLVNEECGSEFGGVVVLRNQKILSDLLLGSKKSMERLLSSRTSVEIKSASKGGIKCVEDGPPLRFECGPFEAELPANSVSTPNCALYLTNISIDSPLGGKTYEIPALFKDPGLGKRVAEEANRRFSGEETTPLNRFLFSKSETNLILWVNEMASKVNEIQDVSGIANNAWKHTRGTGYNVGELLIECMFADRKDLFSDDWIASSFDLMESIEKSDLEIEGGGWRFIERRLQQAALESSMTPGSDSTSPLIIWKDHNSGDSLLPWEDAARLEWSLFGNCDGTRLDVVKNFESIIANMASSRNLVGENIAKELSELKLAGIIDSKLKEKCDKTRRLRNAFLHELDISSGRKYTLFSIATMRELASIDSGFVSLQDGRWSKPTEQNWENSLGVGELENYIMTFTDIHRKASSEEREFHGNVWVKAIREILPLEYGEIPMKVIRRLSKCSELEDPPQFDSLIEPILSKSFEDQIKLLPATDSLRIPEPIKKVKTELEKLGLEEQSRNLIKMSTEHSPKPKDLDELQEELDLAVTDLKEIFTESDLRTRWSRGIKDKSFNCELKELPEITETQLKTLGRGAVKALFTKSLNTTIGKCERGAEVAVVVRTCESINSLMEVSDRWIKAAKDADGLIMDRVGRTLGKSEDKIVVADEIKSSMPLVDKKILPKTHNRLESTISRGEKEKKKKKKKR